MITLTAASPAAAASPEPPALPNLAGRASRTSLLATLRWPELHRRQPALATAAQLFLLAMLPCLIAMAVDARTINGIDIWIKPTKFLFSLALYFATLAWAFGFLLAAAQRTRAGRFVIVAAIVAGTLEMAWLFAAAVQGVPAHFNRGSLVWELAYAGAGLSAVMLLAAIAVQGAMIARDREVELAPALRRALVLGAWLSAASTLVVAGVLSSGQGHWVGGVPNDATGLPLMGWSRSGGDLRVAHFFALHLQQALPLAGWAIVASGIRRPLLAVHLSAAAMLAFTVFTFVQAWMGRPFIG